MSAQIDSQWMDDYARVERAIEYLAQNVHRQPSLEDVAASVALSEFHFQRLFSRWVGISPKRFLQYLTKEYAKQLLDQSEDLLNVAYGVGLSGPGRLHDLFVNCEAVTPGEFKREGEGLEIMYGFYPSLFGEVLLATTGRGICGLSFVDPSGREAAFQRLMRNWKRAALRPDGGANHDLAAQIFRLPGKPGDQPLSVLLRGTNFQIKVWEALLRIPAGKVVSYNHLAAHLGMPGAARAVGNAVAQNPVPYIIPCHRVIRKVGEFGGYQGGAARKMAILGWEMAQAERSNV